MKHITAIFLLLTILSTSCQTYVMSDGRKYRQFFPVKDKNDYLLDTSKYVKRAFSFNNYTDKTGYSGNKKIIETIDGNDLKPFVKSKERYYLYFFDPGCSGSLSPIHKLDSISKRGEHVLIISLRYNYDAISKVLGKTSFSQYPYYTIEDKKYTDILLLRQIKFIKDACQECYSQYKDDLGNADYLLIENSVINPIFYKESVSMNLR